MLLALRENEAAMDVLCAVLEFEIIESADLKMQMITTLQSTEQGKRMYAALCERQIQLRELVSVYNNCMITYELLYGNK